MSPLSRLVSAVAGLLVRSAVRTADLLERTGVIDRRRLGETVDLAWPRVVTGFAIMSKRAADVAIVGWAIGAPAVAGLAFANAYWQVGKFLGIGLAGGTLSLAAQRYGGDDGAGASRVVEGSVALALAVSIPVAAALIAFATPLIGVFDPAAGPLGFGSRYLAVVAPGLAFEFLNLVASRTYAAGNDTVTPMVVRAGGAVLNVVLSAAFVFGLGWGVAGAALGTTLSTGLVTLVFAWGMVGRSYWGRGASPIRLGTGVVSPDRAVVGELLRVGAPLMARRVAEGLVTFPLLAIAGRFGSDVVAALEVGRRVRALVNSFGWGFGIASSSLVGQRLGADDEGDAAEYGAAILRLSSVVYVGAAVAVVALSAPIARLFVGDPAAVGAAQAFVVVAAVSVVPLGVGGSATGALRGAGDTRYPLAASLAGRYLVALPLAAAGLVTPLGVAGLYLALVGETLVPAVLNTRRFYGGRWRSVSRQYRPAGE